MVMYRDLDWNPAVGCCFCSFHLTDYPSAGLKTVTSFYSGTTGAIRSETGNSYGIQAVTVEDFKVYTDASSYMFRKGHRYKWEAFA